jgi:hypothetical protein
VDATVALKEFNDQVEETRKRLLAAQAAGATVSPDLFLKLADLAKQVNTQGNANQAQTQAREGLAQLAQQEDRVTAATKQLGANLDDLFLGAAEKAAALTAQLREAETLFNRFGGASPPGEHFGGYFAGGGVVPGFGFGDRTSLLAEPGEYVIPRSLAPTFAPIIEPLRQLGGLRSSSGVTNNSYGGNNFNFTVNGAGNPDQTVREIAAALRRGVRRGLFTLR